MNPYRSFHNKLLNKLNSSFHNSLEKQKVFISAFINDSKKRNGSRNLVILYPGVFKKDSLGFSNGKPLRAEVNCQRKPTENLYSPVRKRSFYNIIAVQKVLTQLTFSSLIS